MTSYITIFSKEPFCKHSADCRNSSLRAQQYIMEQLSKFTKSSEYCKRLGSKLSSVDWNIDLDTKYEGKTNSLYKRRVYLKSSKVNYRIPLPEIFSYRSGFKTREEVIELMKKEVKTLEFLVKQINAAPNVNLSKQVRTVLL